jgi:hypothetical protein
MGERARVFENSNSRLEDDESDIKSTGTMAEIEREIAQRDFHDCVEEVVSRERYKYKLDSVFKRYFTMYDDERDEIVKKMRRNGERKMLFELDISRLIRKLRNFEAMNNVLLTNR